MPGRISINSLLNNNQGQQDRPRSSTPSTTGSDVDSQIVVSSRENTRTPATIDNTPSPTFSQMSMTSNAISQRSHTPRRLSIASDNATTVTLGRHKPKHPQLYNPYPQTQRPDKARSSRQFRPSYDVEESVFIWYHRIDLNLDWRQVAIRFNNHFEQQRSGFQGFQCKFYRFLQEHGLPSTRERAKDPNSSRTYGVRTWRPDVWYDWMNPRDLNRQGSKS